MSTTVVAGERPRAIDTPARSLDELVPVYVWQIPVRIAHWLIAISIAVLSVTGIYMGRPFMTVPGPAGESFVMGWMKVIHGYFGYVFAAALVMRILLLNGLAGIVYGMLFWRRSLESAMVAHMATHVAFAIARIMQWT